MSVVWHLLFLLLIAFLCYFNASASSELCLLDGSTSRTCNATCFCNGTTNGTCDKEPPSLPMFPESSCSNSTSISCWGTTTESTTTMGTVTTVTGSTGTAETTTQITTLTGTPGTTPTVTPTMSSETSTAWTMTTLTGPTPTETTSQTPTTRTETSTPWTITTETSTARTETITPGTVTTETSTAAIPTEKTTHIGIPGGRIIDLETSTAHSKTSTPWTMTTVTGSTPTETTSQTPTTHTETSTPWTMTTETSTQGTMTTETSNASTETSTPGTMTTETSTASTETSTPWTITTETSTTSTETSTLATMTTVLPTVCWLQLPSLIIGGVLGVLYILICLRMYHVYFIREKNTLTNNKVHPDCIESPRPQTPSAEKKNLQLKQITLFLIIVTFAILIVAIILLVTLVSCPAGFALIWVSFLVFVLSIIVFSCIFTEKTNKNSNGGLLTQSKGSVKETSLTILKSEGLDTMVERPCSPCSSGRVIMTPHGSNPEDEKVDTKDRKISAGSQAGDSACLIQVQPDPMTSNPKKKKRVKRGSRPTIELGALRRPSTGMSYGQIHNEQTT